MADSVLTQQVVELAQGLQYANATRYVSIVGLVLLLHDHIITLPQEVSLIWKAPPSFAKFTFLVNRYLVPISLILVASEMCGFNNVARSDQFCQTLIAGTSVLAIYSIGIANLLVLFRVLLLWNKDRVIMRVLFTAFAVSFALTFASLIYFVTQLDPGVQWSPVAKMCILTRTSRTYVLVWVMPLIYEFLVLGLTIYNALSRPRNSDVELSHILRRDGIVFFLILASLRFINIGFALTQDPRRIFLVIYLVWALITLVLNRFLLNVRAAEITLSQLPLTPAAASSGPFGLDGRASPFSLWVVGEENDDDLRQMRYADA